MKRRLISANFQFDGFQVVFSGDSVSLQTETETFSQSNPWQGRSREDKSETRNRKFKPRVNDCQSVVDLFKPPPIPKPKRFEGRKKTNRMKGKQN